MSKQKRNDNCVFGVKNEFLLLGLGLFVAVFVYALFPITYFPDSDQYYNFSRKMLGYDVSNTSDFRGIGVPLMIISLGTFLIDSFKVFVILQLAMGILSPFILYKLLCYWDKKYALYISVGVVFSLISFGYAKAILSEQAYMFVLLLLIFNSLKLQETLKNRFLYYQAVLIFFLTIIKPISNLLFVLFILYNIYLFRKKFFHVALSFILLFGLTIISNGYVNALFEGAAEHQKRQHIVGSILFYNLYLSSDIEGRNCDLNRIKALKELTNEINHYYLNHPKEYYASLDEAYKENTEAYKILFRPYINNPIALSQAIVDKPTKYYIGFLGKSANEILGNEKGDKMMLRAAVETIAEFPSLSFGYIARNMFAFASGKNIAYTYYIARDERIYEYFPPSMEPLTWVIKANPESGMSPAMIRELEPSGINQAEKFTRIRDLLLVDIWGRLFLIFQPIVFLCMLLGVLFLRAEKFYPQILLCIAVVIYHMLIICILNVPLNRYLIPTLIPELYCAAVFMFFVGNKLTRYFSGINISTA